jgi:hypothetical protein
MENEVKKVKKVSNTPFYFCEACKQRHPVDYGKIMAHIAELRLQKLNPVMRKQGRSNVLAVTR